MLDSERDAEEIDAIEIEESIANDREDGFNSEELEEENDMADCYEFEPDDEDETTDEDDDEEEHDE